MASHSGELNFSSAIREVRVGKTFRLERGGGASLPCAAGSPPRFFFGIFLGIVKPLSIELLGLDDMVQIEVTSSIE